MIEKLRGWKFHIAMIGLALTALAKFLNGEIDGMQLAEYLLGAFTGSAARSAFATEGLKLNALLAKLTDNGKKAILLFALPALLVGGCCGAQKEEVRELRSLHIAYRMNTVPDPKLKPEEAAKVHALADEIEKAFEKLERLAE